MCLGPWCRPRASAASKAKNPTWPARRLRYSAPCAPVIFLQFSSIDGRADDSLGMGAYQSAVEGFFDVLNAEVGPLGIKVTIAEPGLFRTDRAGSSMHVCPVSPTMSRPLAR